MLSVYKELYSKSRQANPQKLTQLSPRSRLFILIITLKLVLSIEQTTSTSVDIIITANMAPNARITIVYSQD